MKRTKQVAIGGVIAVALYAAWAAAVILVLNPLAAVPGTRLGAIYAEMDAMGETMPVATTLVILGFGVATAVVIAVLNVRNRAHPDSTAGLMLVVLALGAPGYFVAAFAPGMSVADAFYTTGGDQSGGAIVLYAVSLLAAGAAIGVLVRVSTRNARSPRTA